MRSAHTASGSYLHIPQKRPAACADFTPHSILVLIGETGHVALKQRHLSGISLHGRAILLKLGPARLVCIETQRASSHGCKKAFTAPPRSAELSILELGI